MTRRELFAFGLPLPLLAQLPQYPGVVYRSYSKCSGDYLKELVHQYYSRRKAELEKVATPEAVAERKRWARQTFWNLIGGPLERTPLNARVTGQLERNGYRIDKVVYESRPGFFVTANLYVPTRPRAPLPAVLFQMGHSPIGKAYASYQRCCQGLVKLGFVVLGFDPMGQGERIYYPDSSGRRSRVGSPDDEHTVAGRQLLLTGDTATRIQVWDAVRSLDYLTSLPFVDRRRIGATGQSGGATMSMFLAAVDDRIEAAAICSGNTENFLCANFNPPGSTDDAEQNLVGGGPALFDRWDTLYPFAPKPLLVSVSDRDFFTTYSPNYIANGWEEFQTLKRIYGVMGKPESIAWGGTPLPHSLAYDTRLQVYNFFRKWLKTEGHAVPEEPLTVVEPEEALWCTEHGSTVQSLKSQTPFSLNKKRLGRQTPIALDRLLKLDKAVAGGLQTLRRTPSRGVEIESLEVASAPGVFVPAWLFLPRPLRVQRPLLVLLDPTGRNSDWHEDELYQNLAAQGFAVCVPDLRGIGDLAPEYGSGNPRYAHKHADEEDFAWAGLILGRPLVGQRVTDLLALIRGLKSHAAVMNRTLVLAAQGKLTVVAQFAAALTPSINRLYLSGGLTTFRSVVENEGYGHAFANFLPRLLEHTDLPEVTAAMGARKVVMAGMIDGTGRKQDAAQVRAVYEKLKSLDVMEQASWSAETLARMSTA